MNTSAANISTGALPSKPAPGRVSKSKRELQLHMRPAASPLPRFIALANLTRAQVNIGRGAVRYICALEKADTGLKRSAVGNRRWELAQLVHSFLRPQLVHSFRRRAA